ncbi:MAG: PAS domain-containing protein [Spirulina sp. SIO3F2]|nr:PAS domain-containing protein [Spirulina sp. SIO3F2]
MTQFAFIKTFRQGSVSLATRLQVTLIGLTVLGVVATGSLLLAWSWQIQLRQLQEIQAERSQIAAQRINAFIDDLQRKLAYLERVQGLSDLDPAIQQHLLDGLIRHNDAYEAVAIADRDGNIISAVSPYEDVKWESIADTPLFNRVYKQQESYIAPVEMQMQPQQPVTTIAVPIRNAQDVVDGVLLARLNLSFVEFVTAQTDVGQTGYAYVVDERYRVIAASGDRQNTLPKLKPELLASLKTAQTHSNDSYLGLRGYPVFGQVHPIESTPWSVVVELPTTEVSAPMRQFAVWMLGGLVVMIMLASGISWLLSRSITRPLKRLTTAANAISAGDWDTKVKVSHLTELQVLATTFNQMTSQMSQLLDTVQNERNFMAAILEAARALVLVLDRQGRIVRFNWACEATLGYCGAEIIGQPFWDLFLAEAERDLAIAQWHIKVMASNQTYSSEYQSQWLTSDQEVRLIAWSDAVLYDDEGEVEYVISTGIDITEREAAQQAKRESRMLLKAVLDNSPEVIYIKDKDGNILLANKEFGRLMNLDPDELIGKHNRELFPPEIADKMLENDRLVMAQDQVIQREEVAVFGEEVITYLSSKFPLRDDQGNIYGICGISTDISDRKQAEEQLQQAKDAAEVALTNFQNAQTQLIQSEKMSSLGQLVAGVAHEINNPMSFIFGNLVHLENYSQNLLDLIDCYHQYYPQPPAEVADLVDEIDLDFLHEDLPKVLGSMRFGAERVREIVLSLRNFSRLDEDGEKEADIHEGINNTLMILNNRLKAQPDRPEIKVIKNYGEIPLIECFPGQLNQVFINLLVNSIDAIEEKNQSRSPDEVKQDPGTLTMTTSRLDADHIRIVLRDSGKGMTHETQVKLFSPFFTTKPIGKGTGLGLSISYQIVTEKHQGTLRCQSALGEGTTFMIDLPIKLAVNAA